MQSVKSAVDRSASLCFRGTIRLWAGPLAVARSHGHDRSTGQGRDGPLGSRSDLCPRLPSRPPVEPIAADAFTTEHTKNGRKVPEPLVRLVAEEGLASKGSPSKPASPAYGGAFSEGHQVPASRSLTLAATLLSARWHSQARWRPDDVRSLTLDWIRALPRGAAVSGSEGWIRPSAISPGAKRIGWFGLMSLCRRGAAAREPFRHCYSAVPVP